MPKLTKLVNFLCAEDQYRAWSSVAKKQHISVSRWIRETLDDGLGADFYPPAERRSLVSENREPPILVRLKAIAEKAGICENRLPKGAYCKQCGKIH